MCVCVGVTHERESWRGSYALVVVHMDVMKPTEVLVGLQEAGQLLVLGDRLREQFPPLPLFHVPAEQEVCKVLQKVENPQNPGEHSTTIPDKNIYGLLDKRVWYGLYYLIRECAMGISGVDCSYLVCKFTHVVL